MASLLERTWTSLERKDAQMILKHKYFFWKNALSPKLCNDIIKHALTKQAQQATIRKTDNKKQKGSKQLRDSKVVFLDERWIYQEIHPFIHEANRKGEWNFQWDFTEPCQFTIYGPKQHYTWHVDASLPYDCPDDLDRHNKIRKLSMAICLSDPKDFKGGKLQFDFRENPHLDKCRPHTVKQITAQGSMVVFPSHLWHRVTPITKGIRYSLVSWNLGKPFV